MSVSKEKTNYYIYNNEHDSSVPLDFSNLEIKDLQSLLSEEPRQGKNYNLVTKKQKKTLESLQKKLSKNDNNNQAENIKKIEVPKAKPYSNIRQVLQANNSVVNQSTNNQSSKLDFHEH